MSKLSKPQISLRKKPKQKRSEVLVESVLEAATRILESVGLTASSTNKIAEKAGVSIGSLYQYFPGKDAIFAKLVERQQERNAQRFQKIILENEGKNVKEITRVLISDVVDLFFEKRKMFEALFAEVPRLKSTRDVLNRRNKTHHVFVEFFRKHQSELRQPDKLEEVVYVFSHSIVGVLQVAALEGFESHSPDAIKKQLQVMALHFLFRE
jgi:AcrR family transcriptional regulator